MTDQSGAFPETLREALLNVCEYVYPDGSRCWCNAHELVEHATVYDPAGHHIYCIEARAALERPRPAPPEPSKAAYEAAIRTADFQIGTAITQDDLFNVLRAAYAVDFGGSAGTGAAPPDHTGKFDKQGREVCAHMVPLVACCSGCARDSLSAALNAGTVVRGGAAQPPPSAPSLPDTFVERAIRMALKQDTRTNVAVGLTGFEASYIQQKYAERNPSGVPREETNHE